MPPPSRERAAQGRLEGLLARPRPRRGRALRRGRPPRGSDRRALPACRAVSSGSSCARSRQRRFSSACRTELPASPGEPRVARDLAVLEREAVEAAEALRAAERERVDLEEKAQLIARAPASARAGARRAGGAPARRASAGGAGRTARTLRTRHRRQGRSVRSPQRSAHAPPQCSPTTPKPALALLQRARTAGLGSLTVLTRVPQQLVAEYPVVPLAELLDATSPSRHARRLRLRPGSR